ncbi:MAG: S41 family peptidase [Bacteroidia bacterium]|nr:S41 family peptidase [Bacteroidia bacterium]
MKKSIVSILLFVLVFVQAFGQPSRQFSKNEIISDIDYLVSDVENIHLNPYHSIRKEKFMKRIQLIKNHIPDSLSQIEVWIRLNEILASLKEGHTNFRPPDLGDFFKFPFAIKIDRATKQFIISDSYIDSLKKYTGTRIISINGISTDSLLNIFMKNTGGENESYKIFMNEIHFDYAIYSVFRAPDYFDVGLQIGETTVYHRFSSINNIKIKPEPDYTFKIIHDNIGLIDMNRMNSLRDFRKFSKSTFKTIHSRNILKLIIDFRGNQGGDSQIGDELLKYLSNVPFTQWDKAIAKVSSVTRELYNYSSKKDTIVEKDLSSNLTQPYPQRKRFSGKLFVLVDGGTFSSAGSTVWCIDHYKLCTSIGEETSGIGVHFGNIIKRNLPNTGLTYYTSLMKWYSVGANDSSTHGLIPDHEIKLSIEDIKNQKDPVLDFAVNLINSN